MKQKPNTIIAIVLCMFAFALGACSGCKSLDSQGVYAGDTLLYNAEASIVSSYIIFDTFVKWEYDHRDTLADQPEIRQAADFVRKNAKTLIGSTIAAVELYKKLPSEENRQSLVSSLKTLQGEIITASKYIKS